MTKHFTPRTLFSLLNPVFWGGIIACLNLFFWYIIDGFRVIPIDMLDGRLILAIHEHWFQVFSGNISWNDLPLFWPLENTLGFSDAFFLTSIPYAIARWLGADLYASFIWMEASIGLIGYFSFYQCLHRLIKLPRIASILLSFLFVNNSLTHNAIAQSHPQLLIIWLFPTFLLLLTCSLRGGAWGWIYGCLAGFWLGLLFLTAYYIPWYVCFFIAVFFSIAFFIYIIAWALKRISVTQLYTSFGHFLREHRIHYKAILFCGAFGLTLIPFIRLYLPINEQYGNRDWAHFFMIIPSFREFFNLGIYNWMWSGLIEQFNLIPEKASFERSMGWGPLLFSLFIFSSSWYLFRQWKLKNLPASVLYFIPCFSLIICLILNFRFDDLTLWKYVYEWIPGASAIRYFHRFNFALILPMLMMIGYVLAQIKWSKRQQFLWCLVLFVVILEQEPDHLCDYQITYAEAKTRFSHVQVPPKEATHFYLRRSTSSEMWQYAQLDALFVAQKYNLKTVNGYSGIYPKNWWLYDPSEAWYPKEVLRWIHLNGAKPTGLYELNWDTGHWIKRD